MFALLLFVVIVSSESKIGLQNETKVQNVKGKEKRFLIIDNVFSKYKEKIRREREYKMVMSQIEDRIKTLYLNIYIKNAMKQVALHKLKNDS